MSKKALVVEGGAMRGIFAAGVLDGFIEQNFFDFDFAIGVSAGSTNLVGYLCGQNGRSHKIITEFATNKRFIDMMRWLRGGHFCDVEWLWRQSYDEVWLDFEYYQAHNIPLYVVTTSILTGKAHYPILNAENMHQIFPASCAIPLAYRDYPEVDGEPMTDGGIADAIPVRKAYELGARDLTVVLSRPLGYRKKADRMTPLIKRLFKNQPALQDVMLRRSQDYNDALEFLEKPPIDCKVTIIAPPADFKVGRFTRDKKLLQQGYGAGLNSGRDFATKRLGS